MYPVKSLKSGQLAVTAAGTAEPLSATSLTVKKLFIKGLAANTDSVFFGDSTVSATTGYELLKSEEVEVSRVFESNDTEIDLSEVYVDAAVNGEGVCYMYID